MSDYTLLRCKSHKHCHLPRLVAKLNCCLHCCNTCNRIHTHTCTDAVSSTLSDVLVLGEGDLSSAAAPALLPGQRMLLHINAPLPQPVLHSAAKKLYDSMPPRQRAQRQREAGGAPSKAAGMLRNWREAQSSLLCFSLAGQL
jgi:hypothetical protein